ncbi:MAG: diphthamide biosynthesis enzyme Dph2 [Candidatus Bathyarchaeia archaeon]
MLNNGVEVVHYGHYEVDLTPAIRQVSKANHRRILLQFPDGLRPLAWSVANKFMEHGVEVVVSADPCYGACDLAYGELETLNCDLIIHLGHVPPHRNYKGKALFIEVRCKLPVKDALEDSLKYLDKYRKIGVAASIQHIHNVSDACSFLERHGKQPLVGKASNHAVYDGQILGCDLTTALTIAHSVDAFIVISGGLFHGIGVQLATNKPVVVADPYLGKAKPIGEYAEKFVKLRRGAEKKFLEAKRVGIIIGLKHGQNKMGEARLLFRRLKNLGRNPVMICAREITPENMDSFTELDAFINTACPRIAIDGRNLFQKPILNSDEVKPILDLLDEAYEEEKIGDAPGAGSRPPQP